MPSTGLKIAIIEDDDAYRLLLHTTLTSVGGVEHIETFSSAEDFIAASDKHTFDLALLDIGLPGMSGLECLAALHETPNGRQIPVIILSNSTDQVDVEIAYDQGARGYLVKPLDLVELEDLLEDLVAMWGRMARPSPVTVELA